MLTPPDKIKILLIGEEYHAKVFNQQLENYEKSVFEPKYYSEPPSDEVLTQFDLFHLISSPLPLIKKFRLNLKPVIYHWIGTDVYRFINDNYLKKFFKKIIIKSKNVHNLVVSENLQNELEKFGIGSRILPLTKLNTVNDIPEMPAKFSVLSYIPKHRWDFYHGDLIIDLAARLPEIDFHILATGKKSSERANIFYYDFIEDVTPFYKKCSVLIRFTIHDGLPKMVLEALSYGRQVIWSESFPHCFKVNDLNECISVLKKLESNCPINIAGKEFVEHNFNESKVISHYYQLCQEILFKK